MDEKKLKIIIADADASYAEAIGREFSKSGFSDFKIIAEFSSFYENVCAYRPDIIFMDVILPGLDGLSFIKRLRALCPGDFSPEIVISSSFYNERYIKEASVLGVYSYFIKPVPLDVIVDAVCQISGKSSPSDSCLSPYMSFGKNSFSLIEEPATFPVSSVSGYVEQVSPQKRRIVKITQLLHDMGIPAHLCGHDYLRDAIMMVMDSHEISGRMTKEIYPEIAGKYKKSPQSVERAIRTALDVAWTRGKTELINDIFRFTVNIQKGRPTNSEFVSLIADYLNYECMSAV